MIVLTGSSGACAEVFAAGKPRGPAVRSTGMQWLAHGCPLS